MVIQELKPSKRVQGRWLAVLEDGSILRLGENEIIDFALCAGKELTEEEAEGLMGLSPPERPEGEGTVPAGKKAPVPKGTGAKAVPVGGHPGGGRRHL